MADLDSLLNSSGSGAMVTDDVIQPNLINASMQECLARANSDKRLVSGFKAVVECLEARSSSVQFCILPENLWNDSTHIGMFRFLMALCHSHSVKMIKVDDDQLVRKIIDRTGSGDPAQGHLSYECMLVLKSRSAQPLICDQQLLRFHRRFPEIDFDHLPLVKLIEY